MNVIKMLIWVGLTDQPRKLTEVRIHFQKHEVIGRILFFAGYLASFPWKFLQRTVCFITAIKGQTIVEKSLLAKIKVTISCILITVVLSHHLRYTLLVRSRSLGQSIPKEKQNSQDTGSLGLS